MNKKEAGQIKAKLTRNKWHITDEQLAGWLLKCSLQTESLEKPVNMTSEEAVRAMRKLSRTADEMMGEWQPWEMKEEDDK
jgi:methionyl-tRNA synthetase